MTLFPKNDPTPISASTLEALLTTGGLMPGQTGTVASQIQVPSSYYTSTSGVGTGTAAVGINFLLATPFIPASNGILNQIAMNVTVVGTAGSVIRLGLYDANPTSYLPNNLLFDSGPIATDSGTGLKTATLSVAVKAGQIYWPVYIAGVAAPTISILSNPPALFGYSSGLQQQTGWNVAFTFAALPAVFPSGGSYLGGANYPFTLIRFA